MIRAGLWDNQGDFRPTFGEEVTVKSSETASDFLARYSLPKLHS